MKPAVATDIEILVSLATSMEEHLKTGILPFWPLTMDPSGGFAGLVKNDGSMDLKHPKGVVMHSRHLWTYSKAWTNYQRSTDLDAAKHAYDFLTTHLYDSQGKGFWWTINSQYQPETENKVLYGQAFAIYGLSQYFRSTGHRTALELALETFDLLEKTGKDHLQGGYFEALDRNWTTPINQALSDADITCCKSMNTNLHVIEAFSSLYLACGLSKVKNALEKLLYDFEKYVLKNPNHLSIYFNQEWDSLTNQISYGHDIEASWLMTEAAQILWGHDLPRSNKDTYAQVARKTLEILKDNDYSLPNELHNGHLDSDRIWWVQAEAIVGMVNGWELTGESDFLHAAAKIWQYIQDHMIDRQHGEWFWQVDINGKPNLDRPKGGLWKTSYHNGRACMEIIQRTTDAISKQKVKS